MDSIYSKMMMSLRNKSLNEDVDENNDIKDVDVNDAPETEESAEGTVDNIVAVVDPDLSSDDYDKVIANAEEIIDETPEGEQPTDEHYIGQNIYTCPICGNAFFTEVELDEGDACPVCSEVPEAFIFNGKVEGELTDEDEEELSDLEGNLDEEIPEETEDEGEEVPNVPINDEDVGDEYEEDETKKESLKRNKSKNNLKEDMNVAETKWATQLINGNDDTVIGTWVKNPMPPNNVGDNVTKQDLMKAYVENIESNLEDYETANIFEDENSSKVDKQKLEEAIITNEAELQSDFINYVATNIYEYDNIKPVNEFNEMKKESLKSKIKIETSDYAANMTYFFEDYDWDIQPVTKEEIGSDLIYHTELKSVNDAERFNYHSDHWGNAESYQQDAIDAMNELEGYIGERVRIDFDDSSIICTVVSLLIDKQYNSLSHMKVLIKDVEDVVNESKSNSHMSKKLTESVNWGYFNKFKEITRKYMPDRGEGETLASQIVTAVNKLVYKWYNDGDVYDNVNSNMEGWANDLTSYANWLDKYCMPAKGILESIYDCSTDDEYENILKALADKCLDSNYLITMEEPAQGSIYDCQGPYEFEEYSEEDEDYYNESKLNNRISKKLTSSLAIAYDASELNLKTESMKDANKYWFNAKGEKICLKSQAKILDEKANPENAEANKKIRDVLLKGPNSKYYQDVLDMGYTVNSDRYGEGNYRVSNPNKSAYKSNFASRSSDLSTVDYDSNGN